MKYDKFIGDNKINISQYEGCHTSYSIFYTDMYRSLSYIIIISAYPFDI